MQTDVLHVLKEGSGQLPTAALFKPMAGEILIAADLRAAKKRAAARKSENLVRSISIPSAL
jgi:hypothetical protein